MEKEAVVGGGGGRTVKVETGSSFGPPSVREDSWSSKLDGWLFMTVLFDDNEAEEEGVVPSDEEEE